MPLLNLTKVPPVLDPVNKPEEKYPDDKLEDLIKADSGKSTSQAELE